MNIAELFVNLGIKGTEKTVGALTSVKKGMTDLASESLAVKAGILGALYGFERLMAASGQAGTGLTNFNATLGVSAKTLQQYQYAARQMGVSNQEVEGSFKSLQGTITKTLMGEGAPKGLARLANLTGEVTPQDLLKFQQNPELLIQRLQQYAQKEKNAGLRNEVLKSFGVGDNMAAALTRGAFTSQALARAPTYSDKEIGSLDKANIAWSNLGNKIEMAVGHFNASHGAKLVSDISKLTDQVLKLVDAFTKLADKLKIFQVIGKAFEGWSQIFNGLSGSVDRIGKEKGGVLKGAGKEGMEALSGFGDAMKGALMTLMESANGPLPATANGASAPPIPKVNAQGSTQNIEVNQNLNFQHDGKDSKKTSDSVKKAVQDSYRQMSAQGQGS